MTNYGYARVSGVGQDLQVQLQELEQAECTIIFKEKQTGMKADRKEFQKLLSTIEAGDTLTVTKLDRFARSAEDGVKLIKSLLSRNVKVHVLNMGLVEDTPMGRLILRMLSAIAEFDRDMIVERLAEGKAVAKLNPDFREGRPRTYTKARLDEAMRLLEENSFTEVEKLTGISRSTLTREKRKRKAVES